SQRAKCPQRTSLSRFQSRRLLPLLPQPPRRPIIPAQGSTASRFLAAASPHPSFRMIRPGALAPPSCTPKSEALFSHCSGATNGGLLSDSWHSHSWLSAEDTAMQNQSITKSLG